MSVVHLWSRFNPSDLETARRQKIAAQSWSRQPWLEYPIDQLPRWWREEGRELPFIRDLFDSGCLNRAPNDIVIYTNADILVRSDCAVQITTHLQKSNACFAYRLDFQHKLNRVLEDSDFSKGALYPGSDLVAFRVSWWAANRNKMPDMILGFEASDPVLRQLVDETNPGAATEVVGIIAHERHGGNGYWEHPDNRYRLKGQIHNLTLAKKFFEHRRINPANFGIRGV
jgi:hypothetical protein